MRIYDVNKRCIQLLPQNIGRLLDIGCSEGDNTVNYLQNAKSVFAFDFNEKFISAAKNKYPAINFVVSRSELLPFKDRSFDVVTLTEVLEHVTDEQQTIDEIYRVLKPKAKLILTVPHKGLFYFFDPDNFKFYFPRIHTFFYRMIRKKEPQKSPRFSKEVDFHKHYNLKDVLEIFDKKIDTVTIHRKGLFLFPASIWIRYFLAISMLDKSILMVLVRKMGDIDLSISYGRLSYSLIITGIKSSLRN